MTVSPAQIKVLSDRDVYAKPVLLATIPVPSSSGVDIQNYINNSGNPYDRYVFEITGGITVQSTHTSDDWLGLGLGDSTTNDHQLYEYFVQFYCLKQATKTYSSVKLYMSCDPDLSENGNGYAWISYPLKVDSVYALKAVKSGTPYLHSRYLKLCSTSFSKLVISNNTLQVKIYGINYKTPLV